MNHILTSIRHIFDPLLGRSRLESKPLPEPEPAYGKPRAMTGILDLLTPEQRKAALDYRGDDTVGRPS